jgi:two-component system sensor kinase FixL
MGIGLSICWAIVEAHDGRLWGESREEGGAAFHFSVSMARPEASDG